DAGQLGGSEGVLDQGAKRGGGEAAAPDPLAQPVADLGADPLDVGAGLQADAADGLALVLDGEVERRRLGGGDGGPGFGGGGGGGGGEGVAQLAGDGEVVGVAEQRLEVVGSPGAQDAGAGGDHGRGLGG